MSFERTLNVPAGTTSRAPGKCADSALRRAAVKSATAARSTGALVRGHQAQVVGDLLDLVERLQRGTGLLLQEFSLQDVLQPRPREDVMVGMGDGVAGAHLPALTEKQVAKR